MMQVGGEAYHGRKHKQRRNQQHGEGHTKAVEVNPGSLIVSSFVRQPCDDARVQEGERAGKQRAAELEERTKRVWERERSHDWRETEPTGDKVAQGTSKLGRKEHGDGAISRVGD